MKKIWSILETRGLNIKIKKVIQKLYMNKKNVISQNRSSEKIRAQEGVRQDRALDLLLFIVYRRCIRRLFFHKLCSLENLKDQLVPCTVVMLRDIVGT